MRKSLVRMVVFSVLACWALGFVALVFFVRSRVWDEDKVRRAGVFLVYELLEQTPESSRAKRLRELQEHSSVDLRLISLDDLERRIERPAVPGEGIAYRAAARKAWYFLTFKDGSGALAAGPVNPSRPSGVFPIGIIFLIVFLPVAAGVVALRVERRLVKIERANQALAVGDLSVRVDKNNASSDELAASFNAMAERIEILVRSRDELVQTVSHELGSPLSRLRFHVDLLENLSEPKRTERIQAMARELDALEDLVVELLNYVQSDEVELDWQVFDPTQSLANLAELVRYEFPDHQTVDVELRLSPGIQVVADQRLFLRAVENLLRNAIRHANGKVLLELTKEAEQVRVTIHDDGPGIPQEQREKVMVPFFRLQNEQSLKMGGLGLGLAIVDRIAQRHSGHLVITTSSLGGARVATVWPTTIH